MGNEKNCCIIRPLVIAALEHYTKNTLQLKFKEVSIAYLQVAGFAVFLVPAQYFFNLHCRIVGEERALYIPYFTSFLRKSHMFVVTHNVVKHACSIIRWVLTCS